MNNKIIFEGYLGAADAMDGKEAAREKRRKFEYYIVLCDPQEVGSAAMPWMAMSGFHQKNFVIRIIR